MSGPDARDYLETVIARIAQDRFGQRGAPMVRLSSDTAEVPGEGLKGALEVRVRTRAGDEPLIHREAFAGVRTHADVDDVFARALSVVLMNHAEWPR
jgi:hypothetical protein